MRIVFKNNLLHVFREPTDPKYYGVVNAAGDIR